MIPDAAAFSCAVFQSTREKDSLVTRGGLSIFDAASVRVAARGEMDPTLEALKIEKGGEVACVRDKGRVVDGEVERSKQTQMIKRWKRRQVDRDR